MSRLKRHSKRVSIAIAGGLVVMIGAVLIPYPGPGWLIVFTGFAILATEFAFAQKALDWLKDKYEMWVKWLQRQHVSVRIAVLTFTGLVVLVTVWLLNTFGLLADLVGVDAPWLVSPFFR